MITNENNTMPHMKTMALCMERMVKDGYTLDFKVTDNGLQSLATGHTYKPEDIQIVNFFRFEGNSDPADNSIMYIIQANDGGKGILVDAYGPYADEKVSRFMENVPDIEKK